MRRWLWLLVAVLAGLGAVALVQTLGLGVPSRVLPSRTAGGGRPRGSADAEPDSAGGSEKAPAPQAPGQCVAETRSGDRCMREAEAGSRFCWQHG